MSIREMPQSLIIGRDAWAESSICTGMTLSMLSFPHWKVCDVYGALLLRESLELMRGDASW